MKIKTPCKICKRRAKRLALQTGLDVCLKHYRLRVKEEEEKLEKIF